MTHDNKLQVEAIKRGTVIDHIPAQVGFKLLTLFKLTETDQRITIGLNLPSGEMGRKDLIKIENTFLTDEQVNQLSPGVAGQAPAFSGTGSPVSSGMPEISANRAPAPPRESTVATE